MPEYEQKTIEKISDFELDTQIETLSRLIHQELQRRKKVGLETKLFFPITGGEGCGKTSLLNSLKTCLYDKKTEIHTVKMLGGNPLGELIRGVVLSNTAGDADTLAVISLLQSAMHATASSQLKQLAERYSRDPLLVFSDRSPLDTPVYQLMTQERPSSEQIHKLVQDNLSIFTLRGLPVSLIIDLDIDPKVGLLRKGQQQTEWTRFEASSLSFHEKVRAGFQQLASDSPTLFCVINADQEQKKVTVEVLKKIHSYLEKHKSVPLLGQPPSLTMAQFWQTSNPIRAVDIFDSSLTLVREMRAYFNVLREVSFSLRENQFSPSLGASENVAGAIKRKLLKSKKFLYISRYFLRDQFDAFKQNIESMSDSEFAKNGWREINLVLFKTKLSDWDWDNERDDSDISSLEIFSPDGKKVPMSKILRHSSAE